jgi:hypothetical protein
MCCSAATMEFEVRLRGAAAHARDGEIDHVARRPRWPAGWWRPARRLVSCVWKWIGKPDLFAAGAFTSFFAASGRQRPAMSLMASTCAPIFSSSLASLT